MSPGSPCIGRCGKVRAARTEPYYEKTIMKLIGVERLKESG